MISVHSKIIRTFVAGGAALLLTVLTPFTASAAPTVVTCSPTKAKIVASISNGSRTSTNFGNIPEASVSFTQGGASASCVIVRFSAETFGVSNGVIVRALLDGATAAHPAEVQYSADDGTFLRAHTFEFIFPSVAPGSHAVRMQYRSFNGGNVIVARHNMVVQFAP